MILRVKMYYIPNSIKQLMFVLVKCCVFFEVQCKFLNIFRRALASNG
jgi:hypothetical protein